MREPRTDRQTLMPDEETFAQKLLKRHRWSVAWRIMRIASASSTTIGPSAEGICGSRMHPMANLETSRPFFPKLTYCIVTSPPQVIL